MATCASGRRCSAPSSSATAHRLGSLSAEDRELIDIVTRRVVAKLLHDPTVRLKEAAGSPRGERLAEALRALFDL